MKACILLEIYLGDLLFGNPYEISSDFHVQGEYPSYGRMLIYYKFFLFFQSSLNFPVCVVSLCLLTLYIFWWFRGLDYEETVEVTPAAVNRSYEERD